MPQEATVDLMDLSAFAEGRDHEIFRVLRDHDPLHWNDEPGGRGFWSVTRYDDIRQVASDHKTFSSAEGTQIQDRRAEGDGDPSIHNMDPPEQATLRRIVVPYMRPAKIRQMEGVIVEAIDGLLDKALAEGGAEEDFDFVHRISAQLPLLIIGRMLGAPAEACPHMQRWTNQIASEDPDYSAGPETAAAAREEVFSFFRELERKRRAEPREDIVSALAHAEVNGEPLRRGQLDAYYLLLMVAGNETTRNLISGGVAALAAEPEQWRALKADPDLLPSAVEEMIRYVSPVLSMRRTATRDVELHGKTIKAGEKVVMWFCSGNRDERVFKDPDRFRFDRSPNEHVGFGWGVHACLGAHLARIETRLFFQRLIERGLRIDVCSEPERLQSNFFRGIKRLSVRLVSDRG
ncbi:cytochrome P450 [uncultured Thermomonospora sp.]|uniref:cytochrome P450 n=1 Tax=uncultured Thermomonospora sp. TaxID=671175 RepID=UPI00259B1055|nr:cytochrome P450 [uncultured Thermomonospora sp.]